MKKFYASKEFYVALIAIVGVISKLCGFEPSEIFDEGMTIYLGLFPFIVLIVRLFWTKTKLTL